MKSNLTCFIRLSVLCPSMWFKCSWFSALFCSHAGTIILLPVIAAPSVITVSSLNDQYGCISFHASAFVDSQPHNTYSDSLPKYLSCTIASLISYAVLQSSMSMRDSIAFMVMGIS